MPTDEYSLETYLRFHAFTPEEAKTLSEMEGNIVLQGSIDSLRGIIQNMDNIIFKVNSLTTAKMDEINFAHAEVEMAKVLKAEEEAKLKAKEEKVEVKRVKKSLKVKTV